MIKYNTVITTQNTQHMFSIIKKPKISKIIDERIHVHTNLPHKPPTQSLSTLQLMKVRSLSMLQTVIKIVKGKHHGQEQMMNWLFIKI